MGRIIHSTQLPPHPEFHPHKDHMTVVNPNEGRQSNHDHDQLTPVPIYAQPSYEATAAKRNGRHAYYGEAEV